MAAQARKLRAVDSPKPTPKTTPPAPRRGRPKSRLTSAVKPDSTEREMLVILREKIAAKLDGEVPTHSFAQLVRQFQQVDGKIRAIDAREAEANNDDDDEGMDDDDDSFDPDDI
jgi:hypothetical protein